MRALDHTHDAAARCWVESANAPDADFPLQNLPLGVFARGGTGEGRIGVAIGDQVLDVAAALDGGLLPRLKQSEAALRSDCLNALMESGEAPRRLLRDAVFELLKTGDSREQAARRCLVPMAGVRMLAPARVGDFTDFFTSIHHARRTGALARPDAPLHPNFRSMPIAYHGRASSLVPSGVDCIRPRGQGVVATDKHSYLPTARLDFELEVGAYVGPGTELGATVDIDEAERHLFGLCLVNDWSARDIQRWESQPLGPFLAKSFMTTVSPWVVTLDALAPFRVPAPRRADDDPPLSPLLTSASHERSGGLAISLQVALQSELMRRDGMEPFVLSRPEFADQYWTLFQMLAHHASNGCNLRSADLLSSGTVSGPGRQESGCLLELTAGGREPLLLPSGESLTFLEDGDLVSMSAACVREGFRSIGFGECSARVRGVAVDATTRGSPSLRP